MTEEIRRDNAKWIQPTSDVRLTLVQFVGLSIKPDHRVIVIARSSICVAGRWSTYARLLSPLRQPPDRAL